MPRRERIANKRKRDLVDAATVNGQKTLDSMFYATPSKKSKKDGDHLNDEAADQDVESGSTPSVKIGHISAQIILNMNG